MAFYTVDGKIYESMIRAGMRNLKDHVKTVNDLNVFPIPDGDTGDNMLMTMQGGSSANAQSENLSDTSEKIAHGMLLGARGNSGVILSQFFAGIAKGFENVESADTSAFQKAFRFGVDQAYGAVLTPTEGTILTVIRESVGYACDKNGKTPIDFMDDFIDEAKRSLKRTPELLAVLKEAGVVDSGGAGLVYVAEGMRKALNGEEVTEDISYQTSTKELDLDLFTEDSVMEYGYCTELLLRLQKIKTNPYDFSVDTITDYLKVVGNSVVAFKTGTIIKIHVHTLTPEKVLEFCRKFGEFLSVKIENMSLQHNGVTKGNEQEEELDLSIEKAEEHKQYATVVVASGEGIKDTFADIGADVIVDGGQSMNPSSEDFISAFDKANADTIFVFPNNGNVILAAEQAGKLYGKSEIRVVNAHTIGDGYVALSSFDPTLDTVDEIVDTMNESIEGIVTAEISQSVRDAKIGDVDVKNGEYIGFVGKNILTSKKDRKEAVIDTVDKISLDEHGVCIIIRGIDSSCEECEEIQSYIENKYKDTEVYVIDGKQDIYNYILIAE